MGLWYQCPECKAVGEITTAQAKQIDTVECPCGWYHFVDPKKVKNLDMTPEEIEKKEWDELESTVVDEEKVEEVSEMKRKKWSKYSEEVKEQARRLRGEGKSFGDIVKELNASYGLDTYDMLVRTWLKVKKEEKAEPEQEKKEEKELPAEIEGEPINCPKCQSDDIIKRGVRHNDSGDVQMYGCEACGYRFTPKLKEPAKDEEAEMARALNGEGILTHTQIAEKIKQKYGWLPSQGDIKSWVYRKNGKASAAVESALFPSKEEHVPPAPRIGETSLGFAKTETTEGAPAAAMGDDATVTSKPYTCAKHPDRVALGMKRGVKYCWGCIAELEAENETLKKELDSLKSLQQEHAPESGTVSTALRSGIAALQAALDSIKKVKEIL